MSELLWNSAIHVTPAKIIAVLESTFLAKSTEKSQDNIESPTSVTHAQKSETMRRVLGLDGSSILGKFQQATNFPAVNTLLRSGSKDYPPGLGNWDNSCYQNSIIQGLASLPSFSAFLRHTDPSHSSNSTKAALSDVFEKLRHEANLGSIVWTPAQLKSMSSWQQQDAQEYFSKLMDEVEKETTITYPGKIEHSGLATIKSISPGSTQSLSSGLETTEAEHSSTAETWRGSKNLHDGSQAVVRNPFEGLLAQRVGCLKCGFVEGLSLIPFNCLTLPLGKQWLYDIRSCLDEYTTLEPINGVDCTKCTLLHTKSQLDKLRSQFQGEPVRELQASAPLVTEALRASVQERLDAVNNALEEKDFSDNTILKKCQISTKGKISSTKTRQAVIARTPKSLAIHINRSVFDEMTGMLSKNHADVKFPLRFSLGSWCLGARSDPVITDNHAEQWNTIPSESMLPDDITDQENLSSDFYELRAALTHYGRHENGHYICYRKHNSPLNIVNNDPQETATSWWRFSDEDVSPVTQDNVLAQGGVFMLFYEKVDEPSPIPERDPAQTQQVTSESTSVMVESSSTEEKATERTTNDQTVVETAAMDTANEDNATSKITGPPAVRLTDSISPGLTDHGPSEPEQNLSATTHPATNRSTTLSSSTTADNPLPTDTPPSSSPSTEEPDSDPAPSIPPLLLDSHPDHRVSYTSSMRTATPRSSRGRKGLGRVGSSSSSMVTAN
ncbi:MAG: hypothetical protein Q9219_004253 [cf. Caloplaca sp. 3 TL-2023]